jgi:DNA-binding LytR/AlgR family response regulator
MESPALQVAQGATGSGAYLQREGAGMSKITIHIGKSERVISLADVQVFRADSKNVVARYDGKEWFVKQPFKPTLKVLYALGDGSHICASRSALIAVNAIVGRIRDYEVVGHYGAVMRDGSIVKISRRESAAFNQVYRGLAK